MLSQHAGAPKRMSRISSIPSASRRSTDGQAARLRVADLLLASSPRRPTVDRLSNRQQYRLRQLHHRITAKHHSALIPEQSSVVVRPGGAAQDDGDGGSARWKAAMKEVILGVRSTDAIIDREQFKGRKLTYWHGLKIKKSSKARIVKANNTALATKCRSCIDIVENATREAALQRKLLAVSEHETMPEVAYGTSPADPESRMLADRMDATSPGDLGLVFGLFHSLPELDGLDSIYKKRLLFELRIRHFAEGSTVFQQWEEETMVCVVLQGCVTITSKHTGVVFQAGTFNMGEVVGSVTPSVALSTARCTEASTLLCLDCDRLTAVLNDSASSERIAKKNLLRHSLVFSTLNDEDLNTLEALFTTITLDDNQVLCKEGSRADHVYVVKRGFLRVFKTFIAEDGQPSRPPSRTISKAPSEAAPRGFSRASSRSNIVRNGAESSKGGIRLKHFDVGEIGPKDILGENGVLQQVDRTPSMSVTSAPASTLPMTPGNRDPGADDPERQLDETTADAGSRPGDVQQGDRDPRRPSATVSAKAAAADGAASSAISVRQSKAAYLVSAAASGGKAEVYVAKAHELKRIQTDSFRYSWKTAQRLHRARTQAWSAEALAQQLRREEEWGALRRETVLQALGIKND